MADNRFKIKNGLLVETGGSEISGSLVAPNITGSLLGTASWAVNVVGGAGISAVTVAEEGTALGTATFLNFIGTAVTATVSANTASITVTGGTGGDTFPYTGSAVITGSLSITGSLYISQSGILVSDGTSNFLIKAQSNYAVNTGTSTVSSIATASYDGAFFDYVAKDGTNYRSGIVSAVWTPTTYSYYDTSVVDIGDTSGLTLEIDLNLGQARLIATANSNNWIVKTFVRAI